MAFLDDLVRIGAPLLVSVLGGPPGLAAGAISLVTKVLGISSNSSLEDIAKEVQKNPEATAKLRELEVTYQQYLASVRLQMDQAEYADRASARSREVDITKATGNRDWYPSALGTFVVLAFTVIIGLLILAPSKKGEENPNQSLINVLVGALAAGYSSVLGYYFGSSAGSRNKDQYIFSNLSESPSTPLPPSSREKEATERAAAAEKAAAERAAAAEKAAAERAAAAEKAAVERAAAAEKAAAEKAAAEKAGLIPPEVAQLNHYFEGCRLKAYPDPASGGEPITIGWGSTFYKNDSPIQLGDKITQAEADEIYNYNCYHKFWKVLEAKIPHWQAMSSKQRAALCSFAYNMGPEFYGSSKCDTLDRYLRDRFWEQVPGAMMMCRDPGEAVEVGIGRRRRAEGLVWIGVEPSTACQQAVQEINTPSDCERLEQQLKSTPPAQRSVSCHLQRTRTQAYEGLEKLSLEFVDPDGQVLDSLEVISGTPGNQHFRVPEDLASFPGCLEPIPQGHYKIEDIDWAGGKDNYTAEHPADNNGIGPVFVPLTPTQTDDRSDFGFHMDWNRSISAGSAGCVCTGNIQDLKKLVGLLRRYDPRDLYVDWGIPGSD